MIEPYTLTRGIWMMLIPLSFAAAFALAGGEPHFQLAYEVETLRLDLSETVPTYHRIWEKMEVDEEKHLTRTVVKQDGSTTATTADLSTGSLTFETVGPDGIKQTTTKTFPKDIKVEDGLSSVFGPEIAAVLKSSQLDSRETKETKLVNGFLCRKTIGHMEISGQHYEMILWNPTGKEYEGRGLPTFESYWYKIDGDTRTLDRAETVTSFKLGSAKSPWH
jgi:hypothetical protein